MRSRMYVRVYGLVQGVAFRHYARREAMRLGLSGWVRNVRDGSVELACEGFDEEVSQLSAWLEHGPPLARVSRVVRRKIEEDDDEVFPELDFQIRHTV